MTIVLTKAAAYGIETSEPLQKRFRQQLVLEGTGANTDVDYDFGDYTGTFWTAVGASAVGAVALKAVKNIQVGALSFLYASGSGFGDKVRADGSVPGIVTLLSSASAGGAAAEAYTVTGLATAAAGDTILSVVPDTAGSTGRASIVVIAGTVGGGAATGTATVTGLATTDTILSVTQNVKGANSLPLLGYSNQASNALDYAYSADPGANGTLKVTVSRPATVDTFNPVSYGTQITNGLTVTYGANPGTGAKVRVTVSRAAVTSVAAGTYQLTMDATNTNIPDVLFLTGEAPTAWKFVLEWQLKNGQGPIEATA